LSAAASPGCPLPSQGRSTTRPRSGLFDSFDKGELLMSREQFYVPVICPSLPIARKNALTIFDYPAAEEEGRRGPVLSRSRRAVHDTRPDTDLRSR
jgi:hypothetical protein